MLFHRFYLNCLAHASYVVGDGGECAVIDPQRDVDQYLDFIGKHSLTIRWIIETHLLADFVSGHRELSERTGAEIVFGAAARAAFPHLSVRDGDVLRVGNLELRAIETPGHTPESMCWLVDGTKLLTGDTLFIGDAGRPDLGGSAEQLYDSLQKLLALDDSVEVWPAHGAGSACGKNIGKELHSTIADQKRFNPNLAPMSRADFVRRVTRDLAPAPDYFGHDAETNRSGAAPLSALADPPPLSPAQVAAAQKDGALVLDVREGVHFCAAHVPGSRHVGLGGQFAPWAGALLPVGSRLVLVADDLDAVHEARLRLARVGLEDVAGYLDGGLAAWDADGRPTRTFENLSPLELSERLEGFGAPIVLDVRKPGEYEDGHLPGALLRPLDPRISARDLPANAALAIVCRSGYRSASAASLLAASHAGPILNLAGGTDAWRESGLPLEKGSAALPG